MTPASTVGIAALAFFFGIIVELYEPDRVRISSVDEPVKFAKIPLCNRWSVWLFVAGLLILLLTSFWEDLEQVHGTVSAIFLAIAVFAGVLCFGFFHRAVREDFSDRLPDVAAQCLVAGLACVAALVLSIGALVFAYLS